MCNLHLRTGKCSTYQAGIWPLCCSSQVAYHQCKIRFNGLAFSPHVQVIGCSTRQLRSIVHFPCPY